MDSYRSSKPRQLIRCLSDDRALDELLVAMEGKTAEELWRGDWFVTWDHGEECRHCFNRLVYDPLDAKTCTGVGRIVQFHAFKAGTVRILVKDIICRSCSTVNLFDGRSRGMFALSSSVVFSRELLDMWVYQVCGIGSPFREAYEIYQNYSSSYSAKFGRDKLPKKCHRRLGASCFSAYLITLRLSSDEQAAKLFSCVSCEKSTSPQGEEDSKKGRLDAVVMDGTAVGILKKLPTFIRPMQTVPLVEKCNREQFLLHTASLQNWLDIVFAAAARVAANGLEAEATVLLSKKLLDQDAIGLFFSGSLGIQKDKAHYPRVHAVVKFVQLCFARVIRDDDESELVRLRFRMSPKSLRLAACDVGRCFCSGSIAGGVLRSQASVGAAYSMKQTLRHFGTCSHSENVCDTCADALLRASIEYRDDLPQIARICRSLCDSKWTGNYLDIREAALVVSNLLGSSISQREKFFQCFALERSFQSEAYEKDHKFGNGLHYVPHLSMYEEALRTGEIFPGRVLIRPRLDFGRTKNAENDHECSKKYAASKRFTPGIFTVQCCCSYPKILGISVMDRCEGVSTALSVLLSRFKELPRVTYYDNACNMAKSIILRVPWLNDMTRIVCDRFHYSGHICNSVTDPGSYPSCDFHKTSNAEAVNHLWSHSKQFSRYLNAQNLMPFLYLRATFLNIRARYREVNATTDIEDVDIVNFSRSILNCTCARCRNNRLS